MSLLRKNILQKCVIGGLILLYIMLNIKRIMCCIDDCAILLTSAPDGLDEFYFLENIRFMFDEIQGLRLKGFFYNCYSFAYGLVYWTLSFVIALPGMLLDSQWLTLLSLRSLSFLSSLGSMYLVIKLIYRYISTSCLLIFLSLIPLSLSPLIIHYQTIIHPEAIYSFFVVLTLYFLAIDEGRFGFHYFAAIFVLACALSTKLLAALSGVTILIYLGFYKKLFDFLLIIKSSFVGLLSLLLLNWPLFFTLIRERFHRWTIGVATETILPNQASGLYTSF